MSDQPGKPSQAEGERETVDTDLGNHDESGHGVATSSQGSGYVADPGRPSQAEGERGKTDEDTGDAA